LRKAAEGAGCDAFVVKPDVGRCWPCSEGSWLSARSRRSRCRRLWSEARTQLAGPGPAPKYERGAHRPMLPRRARSPRALVGRAFPGLLARCVGRRALERVLGGLFADTPRG
jgi:hypothetical protein